MKITKEDYLDAKELIDAYEKAILLTNGIPCYILYNLDTGDAIVIQDKDVAERLYKSADPYDRMTKTKYYSLND
jgi:hypothetical protein